MVRVRKNTVDHFLHDCKLGSTMFILEQRWGNDGYAFWFKLLETLGDTENHFIDTSKAATWLHLLAKARVDAQSATEMLDVLAEVGAIDAELWRFDIIWSQHFVDRLMEVYRKRKSEMPQKPSIRDGNAMAMGQSATEMQSTDVQSATIGDGYPTSEVKLSEVKLSEVKCSEVKPLSSKLDDVKEIFSYWQSELNHAKAILSADRAKAIKARLKEGYSVDRIKQAIRGIKKSPHNMGQNDRGKKFDDIELICRRGSNVDRFAEMEEDKPPGFKGIDRYRNAMLTTEETGETG